MLSGSLCERAWAEVERRSRIAYDKTQHGNAPRKVKKTAPPLQSLGVQIGPENGKGVIDVDFVGGLGFPRRLDSNFLQRALRIHRTYDDDSRTPRRTRVRAINLSGLKKHFFFPLLPALCEK
jgi:hypothetical protein